MAVVTAARLRLVADEPDVAVALVGFDTVAAAVAVVARLRRSLTGLSAAELMLRDGLDLVCTCFERSHPLPSAPPVVVLIEVRGQDGVELALGQALAAEPDAGASAVATEGHGREALWSYRDDHTLAINTLGPPHKLDVTLPLGEVARFVDEVPAHVAEVAPSAQVWLFGHIGDGNIHVNVTGVAPDDDRIDEAVLTFVAGRGGSISAEHGIGIAKRRWLSLNRTEAEIEAFRAIKSALDPHATLNPHVLIP